MNPSAGAGMSPSDWYGMIGLFLSVLVAVVLATVFILRELGKSREKSIEEVRDHETRCQNFDPHSSVGIRAVAKGNDP